MIFVDDHLPQYSIQMDAASSEGLTMAGTDFGSTSSTKLAVACRFKMASASGGFRTLISKVNNILGGEWGVVVQSNGLILSIYYHQASVTDPVLNSFIRAGFVLDTDWHELLVHFDPTNATENDRIINYLDGTRRTPFNQDLTSTQPIRSTSETVRVGGTGGVGWFMDGLSYQMAVFSGSLPSISDIQESDGTPKDYRCITDVHSVLGVDAGEVTKDSILSTDWTLFNTPTASTTIGDEPI